jgi:hypothetical protein
LTPDKWVIISVDGRKHILAGFYGGYLGSDSWRRSTEIESYIDKGHCYEVVTKSGSEYVLFKKQEGLTNATSDIYNQMEEYAEAHGKEVSITKLEVYKTDN